jgi:hypothetical protein
MAQSKLIIRPEFSGTVSNIKRVRDGFTAFVYFSGFTPCS